MTQAVTGGAIKAIHGPDAALDPWPISDEQVVSGSPRASGTVLWQSEDKRLLNGIWECTPGSFTWDYTWDETAYLFEGKLTITDQNGIRNELGVGDLIFMPTGTHSTWEITERVRKAYHIRSATPVEL